jgi:hypothetical protein
MSNYAEAFMKHLTSKLFLVLVSLGLQQVSYAQVDTVSAERKAEVQRRIDSINKAIKQRGYRWKAGITSISYYSTEQLRQLCGVLIDTSSSQFQSFETERLNPVPKVKKEIRIQSVDTHWGSWVSHITNQGYCGDCWAHAAAGAADALLNHYYNSNVDIGIDPDTLAAHAVGVDQMCSGSDLSTGMVYLANH